MFLTAATFVFLRSDFNQSLFFLLVPLAVLHIIFLNQMLFVLNEIINLLSGFSYIFNSFSSDVYWPVVEITDRSSELDISQSAVLDQLDLPTFAPDYDAH